MRIERRGALALAVVAAALVGSLPSGAADPPSLNVVFIHSDDHGWADVSFRGSIIDTPNIDDLAAEGMILDRYHTYPICGPTRVGLMTGRNPIRLGLTGNISAGEDGVPVDEHFLPETFKAAGYQTWMMGKWHLGGTTGAQYHPNNRGFDHFYGFLNGSIHETTHFSGGVLDWQRNGVDVPEDDGLRSTDLMADEAIALIEGRDTSRPFFMYVAFHALHTPYDAPQAMIDKYEGLGLTGQERDYAAMAENMDLQIGRILDTLDSEGIANDTLIVFASDNGAQDTKGGSNLPLRGWKGEIFEGANRTPATVRLPGVLAAGTTSEQFVSHMDWLPTLAAAAGIAPQSHKPLDGRDRWNALVSDEAGRPRGHVVERGQGTSVLDGEWKLLRETNNGAFQLYDVHTDPEESTDVAAANPDVVTGLSAYIDLIAVDADADFVADDVDECTTLSHISTPSNPPDQNPLKMRLALKKLDQPAGSQKITAKGYFNPAETTPSVDPGANGVQVRIFDANGDVFTVAVPSGLEGSSPCDERDGWRESSTSTATKWTYTNKSGGLPDGMGGCTAGAANGVSRVIVSDKTLTSKQSFQFKVTTKDSTLSAIPPIPLTRLQFVFSLAAESAPGTASVQAQAGQCAEFAIEGNPVSSASPKPYCKASPSTGPVSTVKCAGA